MLRKIGCGYTAAWNGGSAIMSSVKYNSRYVITDVTTVKLIGKWIIAGNLGCKFNE